MPWLHVVWHHTAAPALNRPVQKKTFNLFHFKTTFLKDRGSLLCLKYYERCLQRVDDTYVLYCVV